MNATELSDYFRSQVRDEVAPYLWTDTDVLTYMNEAQKMFVRLTNGIYDVVHLHCGCHSWPEVRHNQSADSGDS